MAHHRHFLFVLVVAIMASIVAPTSAHAQDPLTRARDLYESADYEQALQLLGSLKDKASSEAVAYEVFCLVALGRQDEAKVAVQNLVRKDPLYRPSEAQVSPRLRDFFDDVRRPLLPEVTRAIYARAKTAFDKKDWGTAADEFARVLAVLDDQAQADEGAKDLRTLAVGFRDLAEASRAPAATTPPATPTPTPTPTPSPSPSSPSLPAIYSEQDTGVIRPVPISRELPAWLPTGVDRERTFTGIIELIVGEDGKVLGATMVKGVNPRYDPMLLDASKSWTFKPAIKDGAPVRYRYAMAVNLLPR